jgi:hypothetical protein
MPFTEKPKTEAHGKNIAMTPTAAAIRIIFRCLLIV